MKPSAVRSQPESWAAPSCVVCGSPMRERIAPWTARCDGCGAWRSALEHEINGQLAERIDIAARTAGLEGLRRRNARNVLALLGAGRVAGARVLDVGCGYGWFLEEARDAGAEPEGVEPDEAVARVARSTGLPVHVGYFPDAIRQAGAFDVVTFNDVLEHIPDVRGALEALRAILRPHGTLVVSIPNARGLAYRVACSLRRIGVQGPYERLWQRELPSPHLHYFSPAALTALVESCGFIVESVQPLEAISRKGLWRRVHTLDRPNPISVLQWGVLWAVAPALNHRRTSDILLLVARRRDS